MGRNSEELNQHAIKIWDVDDDHLALMEAKLSTAPKQLTVSAGQSSCCIFRVARSQAQLDKYAYHPHVVSIGPYHYKEQHLKMIQEHKWRFLASLISRTRPKGLGLEDYLKAIKGLEERVRACYSEAIDLESNEFIEIMVLDGCFVIELFRILCDVVKMDADDPIFSLSWLLPFLLRDFVKLENQIPFFVLQTLFDLSKMPEEEANSNPSPSPGLGMSLVTLALRSFAYVVDVPLEAIERSQNIDPKHLHDLLRSSFIPNNLLATTQNVGSTNPPTHILNCASKLVQAGIKFKLGNSDSFLDIKFQNGVIEMQTLAVDDFTRTFFLNCVAFEQSYKHCSDYITTYIVLMDCLIDTQSDVRFLCDSGIIENYVGKDGDLLRFFNKIGKDLRFDISRCYLADLFYDMNQYYMYSWKVQWSSFRYAYLLFSAPWSFISALAATVLLLLTVAQTLYTIISYYK